MQFRTSVPLSKSDSPISYASNILTLGSCFAENMGQKLDYYKFQNVVNPFGIIFNPVSLEKLIKRIITKQYFTPNDVFFHNEAWHCFEVHSELSHPDQALFLKKLNTVLEDMHFQIFKFSHCIITLGTSWVYRHLESDTVVANCHKVPQKQFAKELLSITQIEQSLQSIMSLVHSVNSKVQFIFTVSPVRHIKDGFFENNVSKAHLLSAVSSIIHHPSSNYFPSFEIMLDELRDYRFYKEDMLHPSTQAIDYIWDLFSKAYTTLDTQKIMEEIESIQKGLGHRPFNPNTTSHEKFVQNLQEQIKILKVKFPYMNFEV